MDHSETLRLKIHVAHRLKQVDDTKSRINHRDSSLDRQQISSGAEKISETGGDFVPGYFSFDVGACTAAGRSSVGGVTNHSRKTFRPESFLDITDIGSSARYSFLNPVHTDFSPCAIQHTLLHFYARYRQRRIEVG